MQIELKVPSVGESITEVEIGQWLKNEGDAGSANDNIVVIESEKTTLELPAPAAGSLQKILKRKGETAKVGEVIGVMQQDGAGTAAPPKKVEAPKAEPAPAAGSGTEQKDQRIMPAAARVMAEHGIKSESVQGTGPGGRVLKEDALKHAEPSVKEKAPAPAPAPIPSQQFESKTSAEIP